MASFNRVILAGNLTRDPQLSHTASNTAVCKFGLATNRRWRDRDGTDREEVCFVDCVAWARAAEVINQYMSKGRSLLIEGHLSFRQWEAQDGTKRSKLEVVVDNFQFLGDGKGSGGPATAGAARGTTRPATAARVEGADGATTPEPPDDIEPPHGEDDVPF